MPVPIIFDTDAGSDVDDLWALALIVSHPELNLAGVTTVSGDTQARARLVAKTLRLAGRVMYAEHTEATSPEFIAVTEEIDADALKRRYVELVFG